jgi:hypothetical protein
VLVLGERDGALCFEGEGTEEAVPIFPAEYIYDAIISCSSLVREKEAREIEVRRGRRQRQ